MADSDIQGTITDGDGNAVSGAVVYLFREDDPNEVITTTTDSNGDYIFGDHPDGDGSSDEWHVTAYYDDGTDLFNTFSKPQVTATLGTAIPDNVVDNFESGLYEDQGNTLSDYYSGNTSGYERQTSVTYEGSYALRSTSGGYDPMTASDTSGLPNYPDQGDTFRINVRSEGGQAQVGWGYDGSDYYHVLIDPDDDTFEINHRTSGNTLDSTSLSLSANTWYTMEIQWGTDNSITGRLLESENTEIATLSASDSRQTDGGIVFRSQNSDMYYDNYRIV